MAESIKNPEEFKEEAIEGYEQFYKELKNEDEDFLVNKFLDYIKIRMVKKGAANPDVYDSEDFLNNLYFVFLENTSVNHFSGFSEAHKNPDFTVNKFKKNFLSVMKKFIMDFDYERFYNKYIAEIIVKKMSEESKENTNEIYEELTQNPDKTLVEIYEDAYYDFWDMVEKNIDNYKRKSEEDIINELSQEDEIRFYKKIKQIEGIQKTFINETLENSYELRRF